MKEERNIDCMKYRKSTHLAGVDVEMIIAEHGKCELIIKDAFYAKGVNVSGKKTDGYFLEFVEDVKPMVVNSTNRKTIAQIVKKNKSIPMSEARNIGNWAGAKLDLIFDPNVKMMGEMVGGIRISPESPIPDIDGSVAIEKLNAAKTQEDLKNVWASLSAEEKKLPTVNSLKDTLKKMLK